MTRMANDKYAIRDESEDGDNIWKLYTGRSIYDYLKTGYVQDNDLIRLSDMVEDDMDDDAEGDGNSIG